MFRKLNRILRRTLIILSILMISCCAMVENDVNYQYMRIDGISAHVITVDLRNPAVYVTIGLPSQGVGHAESFRSILRRTQPTAAITGTFFDTHSLKPVGDLVIHGTVVHQGCVGTGLAINRDNEAKCIPLDAGRVSSWQNFETVLCAGPRLLSDGSVGMNPRAEGFKDRRLFARHRRPAAGVTAAGKLLLVTAKTPVTFTELANVMHQLGAIEAVGLDGGSSTALYYGGKVIVYPGRRMTNVLLVYTNQQLRAEMAKRRATEKQMEQNAKLSEVVTKLASAGITPNADVLMNVNYPLGSSTADVQSADYPAELPPRPLAIGKDRYPDTALWLGLHLTDKPPLATTLYDNPPQSRGRG